MEATEASLAPNLPRFKKGESFVIAKRSIAGQERSDVRPGEVLEGKLVSDVASGSAIEFNNGSGTSGVTAINTDRDGRVKIRTRTSEYEVINRDFNGLNLNTEAGSIRLPKDAQSAKMDRRIIRETLQTDTGPQNISIDKGMLSEFLLESNGAQLFRSIHGRFFVLAKVGRIHLPFYMSQSGTSGKNEGRWYPFFGFTGRWVIKGSDISSDGRMRYHPKISEIEEKLNHYLQFPQRYFTPQGTIVTGNDPSRKRVVFDINEHLKYKASEIGEDEKRFVERTTGYYPQIADHTDPKIGQWIRDIVKQI